MRVSIQGERGSNSHMAAEQMLPGVEVAPSAVTAEALDRVVSGEVDGAVLPIENSLHGSVVEHYDLLLERPVRMVRETNLHIEHNVIAMPGVAMSAVRRVFSHPVALSQCRRWLRRHPEVDAVTFYDTAGGVKHVVEEGLRDAAALAPRLAAEVYGGAVLEWGVEDHAENYTRFHMIVREAEAASWQGTRAELPVNKMSVAFAVEHRPGTLVAALDGVARAGADLTKIESRPVPGKPWEYVFYVDLRFSAEATAEAVLEALRPGCGMVKELGRYRAAVLQG